MIFRLYVWLRRLVSGKEEQGSYSSGFWPRLIRDEAAALYASFTGSLCELGCGEGLFLKRLAQRNPQASICGIDFSTAMLEEAKVNLAAFPNIRLQLGDATVEKAAGEHAFDAVFCLNTILNLPSKDAVDSLIREAARITRPKSSFIFEVRNAANPLLKLQYRYARLYDKGCGVPLRTYRTKEIEELLSHHDFTVQGKVYIGIPHNELAPVVLFICERT